MTTLLDQILKASSNPQPINHPLAYPFTLSTRPIFSSLKPDPKTTHFTPLRPLSGFQISLSDTRFLQLNSDYFKKLKSSLSLSSSSFIQILILYLQSIGDIQFGGFVKDDVGDNSEVYCCKLFQKFGSFVGRDVMGLVIQGCVLFGFWGILKSLIFNNLVVDLDLRSSLVSDLVCKERFDLVCLCLRCFSDFGGLDLGRVLKCFLSLTSKDGEGKLCLDNVRSEWESAASGAIERVSDNKVSGKKLRVAKEGALLLMVAYDQFSSLELCLHYVLSCGDVDEVVFSSALGKLSAEEMLRLIRYLGKWLRKYERFPQVGPCFKTGSKLGLELCRWVPKLEDVGKALGLVVDEHFSSLALHSEFHEELKAVDAVVSSLVSEGRLCCSLANLFEIMNPQVGGV